MKSKFNFLIIGLGTQGIKRSKIDTKNLVGAVDPVNKLAKYRYIKPHRDPRQNISISTSKAMYNPYRIPKLAKAVQDNFARRVDLLSNLMGNYDLDEDDASEVHSVYNYDVVRNRKL